MLDVIKELRKVSMDIRMIENYFEVMSKLKIVSNDSMMLKLEKLKEYNNVLFDEYYYNNIECIGKNVWNDICDRYKLNDEIDIIIISGLCGYEEFEKVSDGSWNYNINIDGCREYDIMNISNDSMMGRLVNMNKYSEVWGYKKEYNVWKK